MKDRTIYMQKYRKQNGKVCPICKKAKILAESKTCKSCHHANRVIIEDDKTIKDVLYIKHHKSSAFALIRGRARGVYSKRPCEKCKYPFHTEVCHIKPISDFPLSTKITKVNSPKNLIRLCPNCHWELDHGKIKIVTKKGIRKFKSY